MRAGVSYIILVAALIAFNFTALPGQEKEQAAKAQKNQAKTEVSAAKAKVSAKTELLKDEKSQNETITVFGFLDRNKDGKNDLFQDADGDGINDITKKPYPHSFKFEDKNDDKINDLYVDADGDGVNDLRAGFVDLDGDGICDNVIDMNRDFINDITGLRFSRKSLRGYKFGSVKEERLRLMHRFIDENADGIPDFRQAGKGPMLMGDRDIFIDRDGDGIDDRRQIQQRLRRGPMRGEK
jgi:hypothetical protein